MTVLYVTEDVDGHFFLFIYLFIYLFFFFWHNRGITVGMVNHIEQDIYYKMVALKCWYPSHSFLSHTSFLGCS